MLLDQLSSSQRGASAYVRPEQNIDEEVSGFYAKVSAPVLVDVEAAFAGVTVEDLYPYPLPDLFAGNQLVVAGRYRTGGPADLALTGQVNGQAAHQPLQRAWRLPTAAATSSSPGCGRSARSATCWRRSGSRGQDELVKEVVDLSTVTASSRPTPRSWSRSPGCKP